MNLDRVNNLIKEALQKPLKEEKGCKCGCNDCNKAIVLKESKVSHLLSEELKYHIDNKIPLHETEFRIGSDAHLSLIREARKLYSRNVIDVNDSDKFIIESNLGHFGEFKGSVVPLDLPMLNEKGEEDSEKYSKHLDLYSKILKAIDEVDENLSYKELSSAVAKILKDQYGSHNIKPFIDDLQNKLDSSLKEAEYKGRDVDLNKPMRSSGPKKYKVYVKNDKGNVIQVNFGDVKGGLKSKINDPEARKAFADRHNCDQKKDKTKAGYWSCNLPRYAKLLGLGGNMNTFW
jgi:hypothetical protein